MQYNFLHSLNRVLEEEGGWADNPNDPGGATMKGITLGTYRAFKHNTNISKEELKNISDKEIQTIYKTQYWDVCQCDSLPDGIDYVVFDAAVNSGCKRASTWLQRIVGTPPDGIIGPRTVMATIKAYQQNKQLPLDICMLRLDFVQKLKTWVHFGKGWSKRILRVAAEGTLMAKGYK